MAFFNTDNEKIERWFHQFEDKYNRHMIIYEAERYHYGKKSTKESIKERENVAKDCCNLITGELSNEDVLEFACRVMRWGFNRDAPLSVKDNLLHFRKLISAWADRKDPSEMQNLLVDNLNLRGVGIARSSKWLFFINPNKYCIYDSRVSVTLRCLGKGQGKTFPTVGRQTTNIDFPKPSYRRDADMASDYCNYLDLMQRIAIGYKLSVSQIEMGLFMIGNSASNW